MKQISYLSILLIFTFSCQNTEQGKSITEYPLAEVPNYNVKVTGGLWKMRIDSCIANTVWDNLNRLDASGKIDNFSISAGIKEGPFRSNEASDSDVYKTIQGACYALQLNNDPELERYIDSLIHIIGLVQEPDGYIYTIRNFKPLGNKCIGGRWANISHSHELYNLGHMIEAAVAHYEVTGKTNFLDIAMKTANLIADTFGPERLRDIPGHQEIELALAKLYRVTGNTAYIKTAGFFLDERGNYNGRDPYIFRKGTSRENPEYFHDHKPLLEQEETTGHAVRACYMYAGMVDVGAMDSRSEYVEASNRLWENATGKKIYITGGVGASHTKGEAFDEPYMLPNLKAYSETCGAVANMLWNFRLAKYYRDAKYFDVLERSLYNGYLPSFSIHGTGYFYTNPLADRGTKGRAGWFDPPCCPTNIARTTTSIPGYMYLVDDKNLYVNLFIESEAKINVGGQELEMVQHTDYPWNGEVEMTVKTDKPVRFNLRIRIPGWTRDEPIPLGLYAYIDEKDNNVILKVNGEEQIISLDKGYAVIDRKWKSGDVVTLSMPMPVRRAVSDDRVEENRGLVALERGPVVFCAEGIDNEGKSSDIILPDAAVLSEAYMQDLIGGITVLKGKAQKVDKEGNIHAADFTAIPYLAWLNRGQTEMDIWLPRNVEALKNRPY